VNWTVLDFLIHGMGYAEGGGMRKVVEKDYVVIIIVDWVTLDMFDTYMCVCDLYIYIYTYINIRVRSLQEDR